eukprot:403357347
MVNPWQRPWLTSSQTFGSQLNLIPQEIIHAPIVKDVVRAGADYDTIDIYHSASRGIYVIICLGNKGNAVAGLVLRLYLNIDWTIPVKNIFYGKADDIRELTQITKVFRGGNYCYILTLIYWQACCRESYRRTNETEAMFLNTSSFSCKRRSFIGAHQQQPTFYYVNEVFKGELFGMNSAFDHQLAKLPRKGAIHYMLPISSRLNLPLEKKLRDSQTRKFYQINKKNENLQDINLQLQIKVLYQKKEVYLLDQNSRYDADF